MNGWYKMVVFLVLIMFSLIVYLFVIRNLIFVGPYTFEFAPAKFIGQLDHFPHNSRSCRGGDHAGAGERAAGHSMSLVVVAS